MNRSLPLLLLCFLFLILPTKSFATDWAYPFVVWKGNSYIVEDEEITKVEKKIGKVTVYSDYYSYGGNFSNAYKRGTKYFSIPGVSTKEAIAVETQKGIYQKAVFNGKYNGNDSRYISSFLLKVGGVVLVLVLGYNFYRANRSTKHP